ncbi:MAG: hypothetical protein QOJ94_1127 [Sphingomonadales bacterium]|jgi:hypothetical protein|nr:hypothetical protein [Sphingomonadales bacterium]
MVACRDTHFTNEHAATTDERTVAVDPNIKYVACVIP